MLQCYNRYYQQGTAHTHALVMDAAESVTRLTIVKEDHNHNHNHNNIVDNIHYHNDYARS
jgi:hypothetical protein